MNESGRRYDEDEVRRIFSEASEGDVARSHESSSSQSLTPSTPSSGLTLAELKEIGSEVGLPPALVEQAARGLDRTGSGGIDRRMLGVPVAVKHQEPLAHELSDAAWDRLVVEIREVFKASGVTSRDGSLRQWRNGNLAVFTEPTAEGTRIRMQTTNSDMMGRLISGIGTVAVGGLLVPLIALSDQAGASTGVFLPALFPIIVGFAVFLSGYSKGPAWASERLEQMQHIGRRAAELAEKSSDSVDGEAT